ncbi:MAG: glycosyltransferase family 9 protein [bacterium]
MRSQPLKNILILNFDYPGAVMLTIPAIIALRESFPNAKLVHYLGKNVAELLEYSPCADRVIIRNKKAKLVDKYRLVQTLRKEPFDVVISFCCAESKILLAYLSKAPIRIGFAQSKLPFLLTHRVFQPPLGRHMVENNLDLIRVLNPSCTTHPLTVWLAQEDCDFADRFWAEYNLSSSPIVIALHAGVSESYRRWALSSMAELADRLIRQLQAKIVFVGGEPDKTITEELISQMQYQPINAVGKTGLRQLSALLKKCSLYVGVDSGPMHFAAASGIPVVALFGPSDPLRAGPYTKTAWVIRKELSCSPCYKGDCDNNLCMQQITVDEVFTTIENILKTKPIKSTI